jgi:hypothetical protein
MVDTPPQDLVGEAPEVDPSKFNATDVAEIADRLERDDYTNAFESLRDWHILRSLAFKGSDLAEPYRHLLDLEAFDEC